MDPVRFEQDLRVTIQALGWRSGGRYLPLQDDIASVAYWYQTLPTRAVPGAAGQGRAGGHLNRRARIVVVLVPPEAGEPRRQPCRCSLFVVRCSLLVTRGLA